VTRAVSAGNGQWRLHGEKQWIGTAQWAGHLVVFARHPETAKVTAFLVPEDADGLRQGPEALTMGVRGVIQNTVYLDGVLVGPEQVLGRVGGGMDVAHDAMVHARMAIGAACLGVMKRCAQLAARYASRRDISTGRLIAHPVTLEKLSRVTAGATSLECLLHGIARTLDANVAVPMDAFAALKVAGPELAWSAIDDLVQLLGGRGYIETNPAAQMLRDARVVRIFEGPTETLAALIGARVLSGGEAVKQTIADVLGAPDQAVLVDTITTVVRDRMASLPDALARDRRAVHWSHDRAGQLATWALLVAAVEGDRARGASGELDRAAQWARGMFESVADAVRKGTPNEIATLDATEIVEVIGMYTRAIGDVEQQLPQDSQRLDPMLARVPAAPGAAASAGTSPLASDGESPDAEMRGGKAPASAPTSALRAWLIETLAERLQVPPSEIDPSRSFADHGLDSLSAVELAQDLSDHLGRELDESQLWNLSTIDALVAHLEGPAGASSRSAASSVRAGGGLPPSRAGETVKQ
jgi:acyl carrier protein